MAEKFLQPEEQKPPTTIEIAFAEAEEVKRQKEVALGETLGNDIWEELQKHEENKKGGSIEEGHIPEEISQIYGDQTPPLRVLELYKRLNTEKRAEYITDLRIFEEKNKQQETQELIQVETKPGLATGWQNDVRPPGRIMPRMIQTDTEPLVQVETKKISDEAAILEREEQAEIDKRIAEAHTEPVVLEDFAAQPEDRPFVPPAQEGTPKEWRDKLRDLIDGAKEKVSGYKSSEEKMIRRNAELDAEMEKIGGVEKLFRTMGEKYNKLGWKSKIAVGTSLGLGAAFSAGVSMPIALACMSGIAAQRIAGLSTMFLKFEKKSHEEVWGKEKAFLKAAVYTAVMGLAIKEGIEYVSETESAHVVQKWLGEALGHFSLSGATHAPEHVAEVPKVSASAPVAAVQPAMPASTPEIAHVAAAAGAEDAAPAIASEIPGIEVTATPGHGSEFMMKRLWEQLQGKHMTLPANANPNSDLVQLLAADEKTIDSVVHQIASDPKHGFFNPDGTNVQIEASSHMTIDANGNIQLNGATHIAEGVKMTPAYSGNGAMHVSGMTEGQNLNINDETRHKASEWVAAQNPQAPVADAVPQTIVHEAVAPEVAATPEVNVSAPHPAIEEHYVVDSNNDAVLDSQGSPVHTGSYEAPVSVSENLIPNKFGLTIPTAEPHLYANEAKSLFVYGGTADQKMKMITEYLTNNPDRVLYAEDANGHRVPWLRDLGGKGKIIQGPVMRTSGLAGLLSSFMKAPSPDDLKTLVK